MESLSRPYAQPSQLAGWASSVHKKWHHSCSSSSGPGESRTIGILKGCEWNSSSHSLRPSGKVLITQEHKRQRGKGLRFPWNLCNDRRQSRRRRAGETTALTVELKKFRDFSWNSVPSISLSRTLFSSVTLWRLGLIPRTTWETCFIRLVHWTPPVTLCRVVRGYDVPRTCCCHRIVMITYQTFEIWCHNVDSLWLRSAESPFIQQFVSPKSGKCSYCTWVSLVNNQCAAPAWKWNTLHVFKRSYITLHHQMLHSSG